MDFIKRLNSKKIGLSLRLLIFGLFCFSMYIFSPTKESQKKGAINLYHFYKENEIIGKIQRLYRGGHNVPYIIVNEKEFSTDDTTYYKVNIGDSIYKEANSDVYFIFRKNVLIDSSNVRDYYLN